MGLFSGPGLTPTLKGATTNVITLQAGAETLIQPAGWYYVSLGKYTVLQQYDPITLSWRTVGTGSTTGDQYIYSDGVNYRLANLTGCVVGALLTNAGSGYTSAPTVTASAGNSIWRAIVGGAVSTTVTVTNGGTGYVYAPNVLFSAPPAGGIQAEGYATISGGVVTSITVTNQGAGYVTAPTVVLANDSDEGQNGLGTGSGATAVATLTGAGTITGLICVDPGTSLTSLPTLAFSGGGGSSAAATAIWCATITGIAVTTAGAGLSGTYVRVTAEDNFPTTASAYTNPTTQSNLVRIRSADIRAATSSGGVTATGAVIYDGGIYTSAPTPLVLANASVVTTAPVVTVTMGGAADTTYITQV